MADKKPQQNNDNILTIQVKVEGKIEAFEIVSELGFFYNVLSAKFNEFDEKFDDKNRTSSFMRKDKKQFRDVKKEMREIKK